MKLLTLNVHAWQEKDQLKKISQLAEVIHKKRYDAVALQEVSQHMDSPLAYGAIREDNYGLLLLQHLEALGSMDYELHWDVSHFGYDVYEEGIALLTRHPVREVEKFYITSSESIDFWKSRKIVGATLHINGTPHSLYSCHLGWWGDEDEPYDNQIDRLTKQSSHPCFLLGDFNAADNVEGEGYDYILQKGFIDTHQEARRQNGTSTIKGKIAGWDDNQADLKIDHIFTNEKVNVLQSSVVFDGKNEPVISDHYGLEIEYDRN
ncbi:exodeoxyribonuclease III [Halobacillus andaensis]|uniref:Exodeoxyribonuclease III n=1 Tax=Halobacillus andaensis TaxID=1176239 RepID=A0A917EV94_HALAA|nr:endonuclease/exonuclease/phosphatase family protein [Halobacillus andaensis]MBP2004486.1 maltose 6'-phosphate phosphatase [Halobacillus andaensis]GGF21256.1 exodeoxyribonuclease III [Halobacillus andaensis]